MKTTIFLVIASILTACSAHIKPLKAVYPDVFGEIRIYRPITSSINHSPAILSINENDVAIIGRNNSASLKLNEGTYTLNVRQSFGDCALGWEIDVSVKNKTINYIEITSKSDHKAPIGSFPAGLFMCEFRLIEVDSEMAENVFPNFTNVPVYYK